MRACILGFKHDAMLKEVIRLTSEDRMLDRIRSIDSITTLVISKQRESSIDNDTYVLDYRTFSALRKAIRRTHLDALATATIDKHILAHNALLSAIDPQKYPRQKRPYKKDVIFKTVTGTETTRLSVRDEDAVVDVVKAVGRTIVKTNPEKLLGLKRDIDLLTLEALITKLTDMLAENRGEQRWHALFKQNPFILTLAFGLPIIILDDQVSVGGQTFSTVGNKIADFLHRSPQTDNITLIEIKTPKTKLLGTEYRRKVFSPASDLLGAVNQVLDQRYQLQKQLAQLKDNSGVTNLESYAIKCILIAGITPEGRDAKKSWELFRNNLNDVLIVAFDELLQKLRFVHDFLKPLNS